MYNKTHNNMISSSVKSYNVTSSFVYMVLTFPKKYARDLYTRKYYKVRYHNGEELVFMTTNELDKDFTERILDDEFTLIFDFDYLVDEIEKSITVDLLFGPGLNTLPKFTYYDVSVIHEELKPIFLNHLVKIISDLTESDLKIKEKEQLKKWFDFLSIPINTRFY